MNKHNLKVRERELLLAKRRLLQIEKQLGYAPYKQQQNFHILGKSWQERLFLAGNRCGKTLAGAFEVGCHLTGEYPEWWEGVRFKGPIQAWAASVTTEATRDILQRMYLGDVRKGSVGVIPQTKIEKMTYKRGVSAAADVVYVRHCSGGTSTLGFKSYDQGREKFQGTARHIVHLDEEPAVEIYEECLLRTATVQGHILLTMTPLLGLTPLVERFMDVPERVIRAGWQDAPYLDAAEVERLEATLRPHEVEARKNGVPALGRGRVYPVVESEIVVPRFEIPPEYKRVFGMDFGWSNPTAVVWGAYDVTTDIVYIYDVYSVSEASPAEHAAAIMARGDWIPGVCDPSGQAANPVDGRSLLDVYAGHGVYLSQADNAVESGLMQVLERLRTGKLKIFADLEDWLREFRVYRRGANGRIVKQQDHLMDATRYLVMSGLGLAKMQPVQAPKLVRRRDWRTV